MKNRRLKILVITVIALVGMFLILYLLPFIYPVHIIYNPFNGYTYTVYSDYVKVEKFNWDKKHVKVPDYMWGRPVTVIGESCFQGDTFVYRYKDTDKVRKLETVILPSHLEKIEGNAFTALPELEMVLGGEMVKYVGANAFYSCKKLQLVELGSIVEYIGSAAFCGCSQLKKISFAEEIQIIGPYAFAGTGIMELPKNVKVEYILTGAFDDTVWMEEQKDEFVVYNGILLDYNGNNKVVEIPEGIRGIAGGFAVTKDEDMVEEVYVPEGTEYIDSDSFGRQEGVRIYIPASVVQIGEVREESYGHILAYKQEERITIITTSGSVAEQYAIENNIPYEIVEGW